MSILTSLFSYFSATSCAQQSFFGLPTWYKYLAGQMEVSSVTGQCEFKQSLQVADLSLIGLAVLEIFLRVAGVIAVGYVIYGGIQFIVSQGEPDRAKKARQTIINAIIGLVIALVATGFVAFIGARLSA